jgi:hypothetical protein
MSESRETKETVAERLARLEEWVKTSRAEHGAFMDGLKMIQASFNDQIKALSAGMQKQIDILTELFKSTEEKVDDVRIDDAEIKSQIRQDRYLIPILTAVIASLLTFITTKTFG